jgi:hypothetical protein
MSCDCTEKISQLIDGELPEMEARTMQRHLNECIECHQARTDFLSLRTEIGNYVPSLSRAAQSGALARILGRQQKPVRKETFGRSRWAWSFSPRAAAVATFMLAAVLAFVAYRAVQQKETPPAQVAEKLSAPVPVSPQKVTPAHPDHGVGVASNSTPKQAPPPRHRSPVRRATPNIVAARTVRPEVTTAPGNSSNTAGDIQALTAMHMEKSELLLRAFRNVRAAEIGIPAEIDYERKQAQQLIVRNMMLKREADASGDVQVASLLENLEPILLDIANLPDGAAADDIRLINERVERKNIVALLQVNSTVLARALDDD